MTTEHIFKPGTLFDAELAAERVKQEAVWAVSAAERKAERECTARLHTVTVTTLLDDEGTPDEHRRVDRVTFACSAPADAVCRTYPHHCGCESFEWNEAGTHDIAGHPRTTGNPCWMQDWFDSEGAVYQGDAGDDMRNDCVPAIERTGLIIVDYQDEWIEWDWFTPASGESDRADLDGLIATANPLVVGNGAISDALQPAGSTEDYLFDGEGLGLFGVAHASIVAHSEPTGAES